MIVSFFCYIVRSILVSKSSINYSILMQISPAIVLDIKLTGLLNLPVKI